MVRYQLVRIEPGVFRGCALSACAWVAQILNGAGLPTPDAVPPYTNLTSVAQGGRLLFHGKLLHRAGCSQLLKSAFAGVGARELCRVEDCSDAWP